MISDAEVEGFLGKLTVALLGDVTGFAFPGGQTAAVLTPYAVRACHRLLKQYDILDIPALLDGLVRLAPGRAHQVVAESAAGVDIDEAVKWEAVKYLSAVPMTARQALHRYDDGGRVTTLVCQVPHTLAQVERLLPARTPRFQPGEKLVGHDYRLEMLLGQGGFAEVWKASHTELKGQPPVALKFCTEPALLPSLKREIALVDALQKQAGDKDIVGLLGTAYSADPPFLIYEYIDGGNLCGWVDSFQDTRPPAREVISILKMVARAIALAHARDIVHRDLKPANLLITREGRVKVGDFGIGMAVVRSGLGAAPAKAPRDAAPIAPAPDDLPLRHAATPVYSYIRRDAAAEPDPRDDVYALGVIGYQLLVGDVTDPMHGPWEQYLRHLQAPEPLIDIIKICVSHNAEDRYVDAGALLAALEVLGSGKTGGAKAATGAKAKPKPKPKARPEPQPQSGPQAGITPAVKYCHKCGTSAPRARSFCTVCGYQYP